MCPICGRQSESYPIHNSCYSYICPSCGKYGVTDIFLRDYQFMDDETKSKFSHLLAEHKLKNFNPILLASSPEGEAGNYIWTSHRTFLNNYPKDPLEILDRTLLNLSRKIKHPSDSIRIDVGEKELFFSNDMRGIIYIIRQLANNGYIIYIDSSTPHHIFIESNGWRRIEELRKKPAGLFEQVFVAMWFDKSIDNYFNKGIQKAVEDSIKSKVVRVDFVEHNNKICDQIIAEINKSKLLIADFTGNRGGVYFEAGYAQGLGIPVIWTVHEDWIDKLHFDTRQYNHIVYKNEVELYKKLKARIEATILKMA